MNLAKYYVTAFFLIMALCRPAAAAGGKPSFSKSVQRGGTTFEISSRAAVGCTAQIVTVVARRGGKKIAGMKTDVDYLAKSAQAVDLTGDGSPELAVISRTTGEIAGEVLDVYWLDGTDFHRSTVPAPEDQNGYKGGDRFTFEGRLIVRTVPVYVPGDPAGKPSGGTKTFKYDFKTGAFALYVQTERAENVPTAVEPGAMKPDEGHTGGAVTAGPSGLTVTGVTATAAGVEIQTNGVVRYKVITLDKPERIALDIRGADSSLAGKKITIGRFGISTVRIGRNKGFLRVVLDTAHTTFPKYELVNSGTGVLVTFPQ